MSSPPIAATADDGQPGNRTRERFAKLAKKRLARVVRVATVLPVDPEALEQALADLSEGVRARVVATRAGQSLTLERTSRFGRRSRDVTTLSDDLTRLSDQLASS